MLQDIDILDSKILIVDDEPKNVFLLQEALKMAGYSNLKSTTDSREVNDLYEEYKPDLVLLDLRMPHIDGFEVMENLQKIEKNSYIPALVLTAQADKDTRLRALKLGAKDFLTKPLDMIEVVSRIRNMLEIRLLHNSLESKVQERTKELNETRLEVIHSLGRAAEYRDNETGAHVIRMSRISFLLAQAIGLPAAEADLILNASPMHDVGKIGIPDQILLKPGKLNHEEWEIMKSHTTIGAEILSKGDNPLMKMARTITLQHHEKWDGSGYPEGLKGEDISIEGRIVALGDVFDALTSERPYKKAWSREDAVVEINDKSGAHFDPFLVKKFVEIFPEIIKIMDEFPDEDPVPSLHKMGSNEVDSGRG